MKGALPYMIGWGAGYLCMIGWVAGPCCVILWGDRFLQMTSLNKCPTKGFLMINHCVEMQKENRFMIMLISLGGVRQA